MRSMTDPLRDVRRRSAARRGHLPEAVPRARPADRGHRRRDRAVHAPARPQGAHQQPHGGRDRGRRRRLVRRPAHGARDPAGRRHPQLHRRPGRRGAVDERAAPVPVPASPTADTSAADGPGPGRPRGRQPAARGDDRDRGRRLRGGGPAHQPDPRGPRPGRPGDGDAADPPRALPRRLGRRRAVARSCCTPDIERVWLTPDGVGCVRGRAGRDRRRRAASSSARAACTRACCRACCCRRSGTRSWPRRRRGSTSATSRPRTARPPVSTSPAHVEALVAHTAPGLVDVVLANNRFDAADPDRLGRPRPSASTGRRPRCSRSRGWSSTTSSTPTTPATTIRPGSPPPSCSALEAETATRRRTVGRTA